MEAKWVVIFAVAPIAWGSNYVVTRELLPADIPLWGSAIRALPAGLLLMALARALPHGSWWWRSVVLGVINIGAFFCLIYIAAQTLPSSMAASTMALSPLALAGAGWLVLAEQPRARGLLGGLLGALGVLGVIGGATGEVSPMGLSASLGALTLAAWGAMLSKKWADGTPILATTAWQLLAGGTILTVIALTFEGPLPSPGPTELVGYAYTSLIATAVAYLCWFGGIKHLPATTVGAVAVLNPIAGVLSGAAVSGERLSVVQIAGLMLALTGIAIATISSPKSPETPAARKRTPRAAQNEPSAPRL